MQSKEEKNTRTFPINITGKITPSQTREQSMTKKPTPAHNPAEDTKKGNIDALTKEKK
jgi:hypothetical protein